MTHLTADIVDIIKVNVAGWGTVGVTQSALPSLMGVAEAVQAVGTAGIVLLTLGYTIMKCYRLFIGIQWDKEDRNTNNEG